MGRVECDLLNLCEIVLGVLIEEEFSNLTEGELVLGPDVGHVEHVDLLLLPYFFGLFRCHSLEHNVPTREVALLNGLVEILRGVIRAIVEGVFLCDETSALLALKVQRAIHPICLKSVFVLDVGCVETLTSILVLEFVGVAVISVHFAVTIRNTSVTKENQELMRGLWVLRSKVPEVSRIVSVGKVGCWVSLLGVLRKS